MAYNKGDKVKWNWGNGEGRGSIIEIHKKDVTKTISGNEVKRKASEDSPAYFIEQEDGDKVLKSDSELSKDS